MKLIRELRLSSVFPKHCAYCDRLIPGDKYVCDTCRKSLPRIEGEICNSCGLEKKACACKDRKNYYSGIAAPFYYKGNVRKGLHIFKFRNSPSGSKVYAREIAETVRKRFPEISFDFVTAVPMTAKSLKDRGYDQNVLIARETAELLSLPFRPDVLKKIYETEKQHGLPAYRRKGNLAGVFDVTDYREVENKVILLCDDISTSGETLNECAKMLWLAGAKKVYCAALALTEPKTGKGNDKNARS